MFSAGASSLPTHQVMLNRQKSPASPLSWNSPGMGKILVWVMTWEVASMSLPPTAVQCWSIEKVKKKCVRGA